MLGHTVNCCDVRQVDFCAGSVGKLDLCLFGSFLQPLEGHRISLKVHSAVLGSKFAGEPVDDGLVEIVASQMGVAVGGTHLEHTVAELQDGDIEGTAAEVVNGHFHILVLLVKTICKSGCGRLVDDTLHIEACNLAGLLGGLALAVGEVCGNGNDRLGNRLTEIIFRGLLHLLENDCGYFLRAVQTSADVHAGSVVVSTGHIVRYAGHFFAHLVVGLAHETLDTEDSVLRVGNSLTLGRGADFALSAIGERNHRRGGAGAFVVNDYGRLVAFHYGYARISGAEIDSDNFSHILISFLFYFQSGSARWPSPDGESSKPLPTPDL